MTRSPAANCSPWAYRFVSWRTEPDHGTLAGPDTEGVRAVAAAAADHRAELIYSGGIGDLEHLRALADAQLPALSGVIVGRALYERRFTVAEGRAALRVAGPSQ